MPTNLPTDQISQTFLCEGTRFKLAFNRSGYTGALANFARQLDGKWVALVAAENDRHLGLVREIERLTSEIASWKAVAHDHSERLKVIDTRKRQWELEPPHCASCACEPLPAQFLRPAGDVTHE